MSRHRSSKAFRSIAKQLGPTGEFPSGKIDASDEGAINVAVGHHQGNVILDFGRPTKWIGLPPAKAIELARAITAHANEALGGRTQ